MAKIKDERIASESNKVYRICFYVLCLAVLVDLIIKFALWDFNVSNYIDPYKDGNLIRINYGPSLFIVMGLEAIFLISAFLTNIFVLARKGILFYVSTGSIESFPKKRYCLLCLFVGVGISVSFWTLRLIRFGASAYGFLADIMFALCLFILTAAVVFLVCYIIFYIAYRIARKKYHGYNEDFNQVES